MQKLIKQIRAYLNMSQTEFAEQLNVTFQTVNRWENGRALPNKLAQSKMFDLCREKQVPVYDMILKKIEEESKAIKLDSNRILLYHGSKSGIEDIIEPKSRKQCDFGKGFYMGTDPGQALTLICDYEKSKFYIGSVSTDNLAQIEVPENINCDFTLLCKGDSMINARINDGDIVYIREQPQVENGEIAAVLIDNEATLKRVYIYKDKVVLQPENTKYSPLVYSKEEMNEIRILGKAVGFTSLIQ